MKTVMDRIRAYDEVFMSLLSHRNFDQVFQMVMRAYRAGGFVGIPLNQELYRDILEDHLAHLNLARKVNNVR